MNHRLNLFIVCVSLLTVTCSVGAQAADPPSQADAFSVPVYLRFNQVGYLPTDSKVALALTNANLSGQTFSLVTEPGGSIAFTGNVGADREAYGNFAHLYELNFTGLTAPGTYTLRLGSNTSPTFTVGANAYVGLISPTLQFFRVQRCGDTAPALHGVCHLNDGIASGGPANGAHADATGGWHDAGDYLKFLITIGASTNLMLTAYQRHPEVFADADGNNVPDVLDEARIGLDWMLKMWDPANNVLYYQVGDASDHDEWRMPEGDDANRPTRPVWACQSGKGANVAGKAAAALALAASLWNDPAHPFYNPTLAATWRTAAEQIYAYGKLRPAAQSSTSGFYTETSWRDDLALAAAELYRATGSPTYLSEARNYAILTGSAWTFYWGEVGALAHYEIARLDPTYVPGATAFLTDDLAHYQTLAGANSFRAAVDQFDWGSAETMMGAALTALWYEDLTGDTRYHALAQAQRDYVLGGNPWGVSFVNSVGTTWPHHPHHQVADLTHSELVGFWDEGPVTRAAFEAQGITLRQADIYAAFQSDAAVYHDDVEDYITNEPTITMNAVGLALTAWYAPSVPAITPTPTSTPTSTPTVTATPTATSPPPGACLSDANANGRVDVVDIMTTAQTPACWVYLPLIVNAWRQPWPTPTPTATPTATPTPTPTSTTSLCPDPQPPFVTDFQVRQPPSLPEPPARVPFRDPVFGTCLARVTNRTTDLAPGDTSAGLKNEYSRVQSFNADESRILVRGIEATWYLYDARTLQPLGQLAFGGSVDPRWDASNPDVLYFSDETRLMAYNIATQETTVVHEFANDFPGQTLAAVWSKYEGSPSRDGRYWGFMAEDQNWETVAFLVYDRQTDQVIARRDVRGVPGVANVDNAYISPRGNYFIADFADYYCQPGQLGTDARPCGYMVYDRNLTNGRGLLRISGHQDVALDAQGREVLIFQDIDTDNISLLDLATGVITPLWPIDFTYTSIGLHFSGRAFNRPGWALVSTHDGDVASHTWMDDQVFAVELRPNGRVVRLAHTHSLVDESQEHDYWAEPHASANRDLTRIVFTTNWGRSGTGEVEMYLIELPADWPARLP